MLHLSLLVIPLTILIAIKNIYILFILFFYSNSTTSFNCCKCNIEVKPEECFKDRAVAIELKKATLTCRSSGCIWEGSGKEYLVS